MSNPPMSRSELMSRVRGKDTGPELTIRRGLHARGFRYRLHAKDLPGRPDIILPRWRAVILVHGCFWHGHTGCGRTPKTRQDFWIPKIESNRERDRKVVEALRAGGWRVLIVWECCLVGTGKWEQPELINQITKWLKARSNMRNSGEADRPVRISRHPGLDAESGPVSGDRTAAYERARLA